MQQPASQAASAVPKPERPISHVGATSALNVPAEPKPVVVSTATGGTVSAQPTAIREQPRPGPAATGQAKGYALNADGLAKIMEELLKRVEQAGKRSVKAQLADARLAACSDGIATLVFQRDTIRERVAQDEIRKWLEELLAQIMSMPMRVQCVADRPATKASPAPVKSQKEEIPPVVLKVQQIFGGNITKIEEVE